MAFLNLVMMQIPLKTNVLEKKKKIILITSYLFISISTNILFVCFFDRDVGVTIYSLRELTHPPITFAKIIMYSMNLTNKKYVC